MRQYLVDSDILVDFFKKKDYAVSLIDKIRKQGNLTISILSVTELRAGWNDQQTEYFLPRLYQLVDLKNLNQKIVEQAGKFRWEYKLKGVSLPAIDSLIAATAILEKCQLVTRNRKDFPMPEIKFYPLATV